MPSNAYFAALEDSKRHHAVHKTYSGSLLRPHAPFIKEIIDRLGCRTVLDYGAGKCAQYRWRNEDPIGSIPVGMTIEEFWGIEVVKYDPAYPPIAAEPTGKFDLVICTHTLGAIPVADLPWVVGRLSKLADKAVYVAEKIGPTKKKVFRDPSAMPHGWTPDQWRNVLRLAGRPGLEVHFAARVYLDDGSKVIERGLVR